MAGPKRAGELSFYEELGVANDASAEEIRNSFRAMARILHPDQQTDPNLKEVAERQMRKLNRIHAVLADPERRRRYDDLLEEEHLPREAEPGADENGPHRWLGWTVWGGAMLVCASLLFWLWTANSGGGVASGGAQAAAYAAEAARLRADLRSVVAQRDAAMQELARLRGRDAAADPAAQAPPAFAELPAITELPPAAAVSVPSPALARPVNRGLAGVWFYVKPPEGQQNKNQALYPPEFIEAAITEANGVVRGRYRARFRIVDRAISPDVNFSFTGPAGAAAPSFPWNGPGGARGEISLRLASENQLRLDWTASDLGSQQGLASGTALLQRRIE